MHPIWMAVPVLIWALHFTLIYGFTSLACARSMASLVPWGVALASGAGALAALACLRYAMRHSDGFRGWMTGALAVVTLVAIAYETMGPYFISGCR
jgi:hypothetical protein